MNCPFCEAVDTKAIDYHLVSDGSEVRCQRKCLVCHESLTTFEAAEFVSHLMKKNRAKE